jgi:uncharacterized protein
MWSRITEGRTDLVFEYLLHGSATDADKHGVSLIQWCAYYGDVSAIRFLAANGESLRRMGENLDLNGACFHGHWELTEFLVEQGADVNYPLPDTGETPLHAALSSTDRSTRNRVLQVLLTAGADPNVATKPGVETDAFMRDVRTRGETPLHRAAAYGDAEAIDLLVNAGAKLEIRDINGDSPLTWASYALRSRDILRKLCFGPHRVRG